MSGRIFFICLMLVALGASFAIAQMDAPTKLKDAMNMLKEETKKIGEPKSDGISLFFGSSKMNGNYTIVDEIKKKFDCTATLFVKKGEEFIRISTNVIKDGGNRAVGTVLDPKGKAIEAIVKGENFQGVVDILGKPYDTLYEPIRNASSETIGVFYVGIPK